jgi:hypothetical protein
MPSPLPFQFIIHDHPVTIHVHLKENVVTVFDLNSQVEFPCKSHLFDIDVCIVLQNNGISSHHSFLTSFLLWTYSGNYRALVVHPTELQ